MAAAAAGPGQHQVGHFFFLSTNMHRNCFFHHFLNWGSISGTIGTFQFGGVFFGQRSLTVKYLLSSGCSQGNELLQKGVAQISRANSQQKFKYRLKKVSLVQKRRIENMVENSEIYFGS